MDYTIENTAAETVGMDESLVPTAHPRVFVNPDTGSVVIAGQAEAIRVTLENAD